MTQWWKWFCGIKKKGGGWAGGVSKMNKNSCLLSLLLNSSLLFLLSGYATCYTLLNWISFVFFKGGLGAPGLFGNSVGINDKEEEEKKKRRGLWIFCCQYFSTEFVFGSVFSNDAKLDLFACFLNHNWQNIRCGCFFFLFFLPSFCYGT